MDKQREKPGSFLGVNPLTAGSNCILLTERMTKNKSIRGFPILTIHSPGRDLFKWNVLKKRWVGPEVKYGSESRITRELSRGC
jgi:hypothetical protein